MLYMWSKTRTFLIVNEFSQAILGDQNKDEEVKWIMAIIEEHGEILPSNLKTENREQAEFLRKYENLKIKENLLFYTPIDDQGKILQRYVVPKYARPVVMEKLHKSIFSGHLGMKKTLGRAKERVWWPFCRTAIENFIRECEDCQKIKRGLRFNPGMQKFHDR